MAEDCHRELLVVETAATVAVISLKEGTKLLLWIVHARLLKYALELGEVNRSRIHDVEVLEHLHEASLFRQLRIRLLNEFIFESFLKPKKTK